MKIGERALCPICKLEFLKRKKGMNKETKRKISRKRKKDFHIKD